jgi:cell wall assembly regulator SMI1
MEDIWQRIDTWLETHAPQVFQTLQPGASEAQILAAETALGVQFPEDVRRSYGLHNGQQDYTYGLCEGREFLSLERIQQEWQVWKSLLDGGDFEGSSGDSEAGIRSDWWNPQWIPLTYDGAGNHDCLDLDPADGGSRGQIIAFWHDASDRTLVAPSFRTWWERYAEDLEAGLLVFSEEYGGIVSLEDL